MHWSLGELGDVDAQTDPGGRRSAADKEPDKERSPPFIELCPLGTTIWYGVAFQRNGSMGFVLSEEGMASRIGSSPIFKF